MKISDCVEKFASTLAAGSVNLARQLNDCRFDERLQNSERPSIQELPDDDVLQIVNILAEELRSQSFVVSESTLEFGIKNPYHSFALQNSDRFKQNQRNLFGYLYRLKLLKKEVLRFTRLHLQYSTTFDAVCAFIDSQFENLELAIQFQAMILHPPEAICPKSASLEFDSFAGLLLPVFIFTQQGQLLYANPAAMSLIESFSQVGAAEDQGSFIDHISMRAKGFFHSASKELGFTIALKQKTEEKKYRTTLQRYELATLEEEGILATVLDWTEHHTVQARLRTAKERAENLDRQKTSFLANMSHEIRTPMNAILGFTDLLLERNFSTNDRNHFLHLIRNSSADLLHIIDDIIDFSKLESKKLKVKYRVCNPYSLLLDLKAVIEQTLRKYNHMQDVDLIVDVDTSLRTLQLYTDADRLKQVILNLLTNSAKFTERGTIQYGYKVLDDAKVIFTVRDSGIGMPAEFKDAIFESHFQIENNLPGYWSGAGLGLAISKSIVELLHGTIRVESAPGEGTCFNVVLPLHPLPEPQCSESRGASLSSAVTPDLRGYTLLIAEDDQCNYIYLSEVLKPTGVQLIRACNGVEAIERVESHDEIDLVLMDIKMPMLDGYQASRYISAQWPHLPIIAQTANALDGDEQKCRKAGCSAYVTKPLTQEKLFEAIRVSLSKVPQPDMRLVNSF